jgi:integration host factor subunit alpha
VDLIYERIGSSKKEAGEIVEEVFRIIEDCLQRGEKVKISGFGSFVVNHKRARRGRNPQTGSAIIIDSRRVLSFKPSQVLKSLVANGTKRSA